jgi:hypothetical protein
MTMSLDGTLGIQVPSSSTNNSGAVAWGNFYYNGSSIVIRASYNIASITRTSAGIYTINFSNSLVDSNYALIANASTTQSNTYVVVGVYTPSNTSYSSKTTSACTIDAYSPAVSNYDPYEINFAVFR